MFSNLGAAVAKPGTGQDMAASRRVVGVYQPRSRREAIRDALAQFRDALNRLMSETARRGLGLALILAALALAAALVSFDSADPGFDNATGRAVGNWLGIPGAWAASFLLRSLGAGAAALVLPLALWGWRLAMGGFVTQTPWRVLAFLLGLIFLSAGLGGIPFGAGLPAGLGGLLGTLNAFFTAQIAESFGLSFLQVVIPVLFIAFGVVLVFSAVGIALARLWTPFRAMPRIASSVAGLAGALSFRRRARADEDDEEFDEDAYDEDEADEDLYDDEDEADALDGADDEERPGKKGKFSVAPEPFAPRGERKEPRVQRSEKKAAQRKKDAGQPALNLTEGEYQLPPLSLLSEPPPKRNLPSVSDDALEENARLLESVLSDFGVRGRIVAVRPGPVVTLYELEPAAGLKSSRVISLSDDIARSMSAVAARVAVIPGRNVIGIELPNQRRETVYLRELFATDEYEKSRAPLTLALGKTIGGEPVMADLAKMPHLLIAGTTGSGKSVGLNTMILSLLYRMPPEQCRLIMIDPKMLELSVYDDIPHLLAPVVIDPKKAVVALKWAVREMEQRYGKMAKVGVRGVEAFNERVRKAKDKGEVLKRTVQTGFDRETGSPIYEDERLELEPMPYIVVVVDEMADLMMIAGKEIEGAIQRLAQMARAAGIHLIAATQRPSVDVITGTIKANFPTRISFQVTSKIDSRTILGEQGAEQLLGQGDMLYMMAGGRIRRVHGPFVADDEVEEIVKFLKKQGRPEYLDAVTEEPDEDEDPYGMLGGEGSDDLFDKAVAIVARERKVSTSYIQRRLQIGYNRAARLIEKMEEDGMISKPNHQGKREILLPEH
jgi:S-DNA-T family DNA segregation ATPase FtsK/SpoIIIE